jgi:hypothetical protein
LEELALKKRIVGIVVCLFLITTLIPCSVFAGDPDNPEIEDEEGDPWGFFSYHPFLLKICKLIGLIDRESFDFIDIISAWFYENETSPDYLYVTMKCQDLAIVKMGSTYTIQWLYNGTKWFASCKAYLRDNEYLTFYAGESRVVPLLNIQGWFSRDEKIVTYKIPKTLIGDPKRGDVLTHVHAITFVENPFGNIFGSAATDRAFGDNYVIHL